MFPAAHKEKIIMWSWLNLDREKKERLS